jgi:hypothetical protein
MLPDVQQIFLVLGVRCEPHRCFKYLCLPISKNYMLCEFMFVQYGYKGILFVYIYTNGCTPARAKPWYVHHLFYVL